MQVSWGDRDGRAVLVVRGLGSDAGRTPRVYPTEARRQGAGGGGPSMAGRWTTDVVGDLVFLPRFAFLAGTSYTVVAPPVPGDVDRVLGDLAPGDLAFADLNDDESVEIEAATVAGVGTTRVVSIEPEGPLVPRNLLRLHVTFSAPMSEGRAARHIRFEQVGTGEVLADALLALDPELWDDARQRLTVLLDPARIKRGLAPHLEAGYPLAEGERVRFVVDPHYPDALGRALTAGDDVTYEVGPDLRGHVRPDRWTPEVPPPGSRAELVLRFDRQLDRPLSARCIRVAGVAGVVSVAADGRSWSFRPAEPWVAGPVTVVVDPRLEDIAGNSVARVFDRDLDLVEDDPPDASRVGAIEVVIAPG